MVDEEIINELKRLLKEVQDKESNQVATQDQLSYIAELEKSIDPHFKDLNLNEVQMGFIRASSVSYSQSIIDERLQEVFPESMFEFLDEMLESKEIEESQIPSIIDSLYTVVTGNSILDYAAKEVRMHVPYMKTQLQKMKQELEVLAQLTIDKQEYFQILVDEGRIEEAQSFLDQNAKRADSI